MSRIYALLKSNDWAIKYVRIRGEIDFISEHGGTTEDVGSLDPEDYIMYVDFREDILATIIHECLHALYPNASETLIKKTERFIMENMSGVQARRVHYLSAFCLI